MGGALNGRASRQGEGERQNKKVEEAHGFSGCETHNALNSAAAEGGPLE